MPLGQPKSKDPFAEQVERAYTLLLSGKVARAFDLTREDPRLRDRYGRHMYGQSLLLARRLVGAGVPVVQVNMGRVQTWDTHSANFKSLKDRLLPPTDQGVAALLDDLEARGMLDETMVVVTGEFGRTPRIGASTGNDNTQRRPRSLGGRFLGRVCRRRRARGPDDRPVGQDGCVSGQPPLHPGRLGGDHLPRARRRPGHRAARPAQPADPALHRRGDRAVIHRLKSPGTRAVNRPDSEEFAMSIVQKMRSQLAEAMKARDTVRLDFLRYWIAQLTLGTGAEMSEADAIKKMRGVLKEAKSGLTTFTAEELALLREWVPPTADRRADRRSTQARRRPDQGSPKGGHGHGHRDEGAGRPAGGKRRRQSRDRRDASLKLDLHLFRRCAMAPKSVYRRVLGDRFDALPEVLKRFHDVTRKSKARGTFRVTRGSGSRAQSWSRRFWACPRQANAYPCTSKSWSKETASAGSATFRAKP